MCDASCDQQTTTGRPSSRLAYDRAELLSWYCKAPPAASVVERLRDHGLWCVCRLRRVRRRHRAALCRIDGYRGRRSGRSRWRPPYSRPAGNSSSGLAGSRRVRTDDTLRSSLLPVHVDRHSAPRDVNVVFGCINIRSVANKIDDLLEVRRDHLIDVLFLVETWHNSDSVSLRRLRADGFQVVDRARPRVRDNVMTTNHGGVAAVAVPGIRLTLLDLGVKPESFELMCVRVVSGSSACIVAVIYRPGTESVTAAFFCELSDVLYRLVTFVDPVFLVGDVNIRLERTAEPTTGQFTELLAAHGLTCCVTAATHDLGGTLDIVAMRDDLPLSIVDVLDIGHRGLSSASVLDVGLSDHRLLRWSASMARLRPVYTTATIRPWRKLDTVTFRDAISSSSLCRSD